MKRPILRIGAVKRHDLDDRNLVSDHRRSSVLSSAKEVDWTPGWTAISAIRRNRFISLKCPSDNDIV